MKHYIYIKGIMLLAAMLLAACGGSDGIDDVQGGADWSGDTQQKEIRIISNINSMPDGTRTTTYSNAADLQAVGQFTCAAYKEDNTAYIPAISTDWNSTINRWEFDGGNYHRYWPETGNLDFFAYMPSAGRLSSDAKYINSPGPAYDPATHTVTFSCDMTKSEIADKEFVFGMTLDMDGETGATGATGVPIQFRHPFARIRFQLSDASKDNVTINSITFSGNDYYKTADYSCTCSYDDDTDTHTHTYTSTWSNEGGAAAFGSCELNTDYLVIPQTPGSRMLTVNATWKAISTAPQNVSTIIDLDEWESGRSYTYILTLKDNILIVNTSKFTEQW